MSERFSIRVITQRDVIRGARDLFMEQYRGEPSGYTFALAEPGETLGKIRARLRALDLETCSRDDVNLAIEPDGSSTWGDNKCDICARSMPVIARLGEEPDYDTRHMDVCLDCLDTARAAIVQALERREG